MEHSGEIIIYQTPEGMTELEVRLDRETLWLSQKQMSLLFDKDTDTIGLHLRNIYKEGELEESATTEESSVVQKENCRRRQTLIRS
ncbi:MAG TPA: cell filamentation protein Fic [Bacteroidales bacterium]|nr:cell filamentation protein Fic [Bacteroidales bacterium]